MATYILIDSMNLFFRAKHAVGGKDITMKTGMAMHTMFASMRKAWNDFNGDHIVYCMEGRSWRKDFYPPYKQNRKVTAAKRTPREVEDDEIFMESYQDLCEFMIHQTNCTTLQCGIAEADDMIAMWIQAHPEDDHIIISTDSDFYQLLAPNVKQYNGVTQQTITTEGIFDDKGKRVKDKKTGESKVVPDPEWLLFEKCVRGDTSDNIFAAYPGARIKGTKNKVGIQEAFEDRDTGGFNYNNFMLQRWVDHDEQEHRVRDDYERNQILIDLTRQPDDVREACMEAVHEAVHKPQIPQVGIRFMKFCTRWDLRRLSESPTEFGKILNAGIAKGS
jgi:hypothetical protein